MRRTIIYSLSAVLLFLGRGARAQAQASGSALQASNIFNPNISVIGWFQGEAGRGTLAEDEQAPSAFQFKEAEIAFQSVVDPYARADFFMAAEDEGMELEEGYLTWFSLPGDLSLKVGKFKGSFGKFNLVHRPETAFADRPLVHEKYFGEEGLAGAGASLSWHVPNPWLLVSLDGDALTMPEASEALAFGKAKRRDFLYVGRLGVYHDLTEAANVSLGADYAHGAAGQEFNDVTLTSPTLKSQAYGLDMTFRWKNPRRATYRSILWQTEILWNNRDQSADSEITSMGLFSHFEYQFARRWRAGGRYDWSQSPADNEKREFGGLFYLTFSPSEFSRISLQGKQVKRTDGTTERLGFFKLTFSIGPHGTHPF
ncbi:MAG: hypothetical protein HY547_05620 [Elusimicrobia bacterium]|nr:hypothetical protein [Elusimicrobiota bacterium]